MKKNEYLAQFHARLQGLPEHEKTEIILDFEEHFSAGLAKGKTEEEICEDLGDPVKNAAQYTGGVASRTYKSAVPPVAAVAYAGTHVQEQRNNSSEATYIVLFILSVFLAATVFTAMVPVLISGGAVFASGIAAGIAIGSWIIMAIVLCVGIFLMSLSVLLMLASVQLCRFLYKKYRGDKGGNWR